MRWNIVEDRRLIVDEYCGRILLFRSRLIQRRFSFFFFSGSFYNVASNFKQTKGATPKNSCFTLPQSSKDINRGGKTERFRVIQRTNDSFSKYLQYSNLRKRKRALKPDPFQRRLQMQRTTDTISVPATINKGKLTRASSRWKFIKLKSN